MKPVYMDIFQSTLPVRGATRTVYQAFRRIVISIHAPREGSDEFNPDRFKPVPKISIHAPREGSDSNISQKDGLILGDLPKVWPEMPRNREIPAPSGLLPGLEGSFSPLFPVRTGRGDGGRFPFALRESAAPQADRSACTRSARSYSRSGCPGSKTAGCPVFGP